jgi:hypothetical protein
VLVIYEPGSRTVIATRRESRRPIAAPKLGDEVRIARQRLRVRAIAQRLEHRGSIVEHITEVFTRLPRKRARRELATVVTMPTGDDSMVAEFLRFHVLVRVFDGDPDAWLAHLRERGDDGPDVRFVRWIRSRLRQDPTLLGEIRRMVDATPFWRAAEA